MDLGLHNANVFVAASSAGLGAAAARRFSLEGANVAINGRNVDTLNATAESIRAESGGRVMPFPGDLTDSKQVKLMIEGAAEAFGGLDILITNAGGPPAGTFDTVTPEQWDLAYQLTVKCSVDLIRAALPYLRQSSRAAILTITSVSVKQPVDNLILSNSVRMGVIGLTKTLAQELGPEGIRVNSILPGYTRTRRVEQLAQVRAEKEGISVEEALADNAANTPLRRVGQPEEFGNVAVFLCSPAASYVTGAMLPVDGGSIKATL
jgi:3-oxoacyl-[acyl-carrier protein] reductase